MPALLAPYSRIIDTEGATNGGTVAGEITKRKGLRAVTLFSKRCQYPGCREIFTTTILERGYCDKHGKEESAQILPPDEIEDEEMVTVSAPVLQPRYLRKAKEEEAPIPEKPEKPKPGERHRDYFLALHQYYQVNKEAILSDLAELGIAKTVKRWRVSYGTLIKMSGRKPG